MLLAQCWVESQYKPLKEGYFYEPQLVAKLEKSKTFEEVTICYTQNPLLVLHSIFFFYFQSSEARQTLNSISLFKFISLFHAK